MAGKPSTKSSGDPAAVYGTGAKRENRSGTLDTALAASKAAYQKDPAACYIPHDGE